MLITSHDIDTIRQFYFGRDHNNDLNDDNLGFGFIHYSFIRNIKPERVLCIGSQRGYIPSICALACRHNGIGRVDFVDAGYDCKGTDDTAKNSWGGVGVWKGCTSDYWKPLGVSDYIRLYVMKTEEFVKISKEEYGYIYIDGDHSFEGVMTDYHLFYPRLSVNGLMVFHDISTDKMTDWGKCGVKDFWDSLEEPNKISIFRSAGLGILQKVEE
jgi:hypothetical protein